MTIDELKRRIRRGPGRLRTAAAVSVVSLGLVAGTLYAGAPSDAVMQVVPASESGYMTAGSSSSGPSSSVSYARSAGSAEEAEVELSALEARVERVTGAWSGVASYYEAEVAPIERVLHRYSRDTALVERIAVALVREANRVQLEPRLLLAVLLVENPWLDPEIRSPVGAIGLMQVMPVHRGGWSACGADLEDIDSNICHGARIFAHYFHRSNGNLDRALLRYNGCVNGTNTPNCHQYPNHVFAHAGRASIMAWLDQGPAAGSP